MLAGLLFQIVLSLAVTWVFYDGICVFLQQDDGTVPLDVRRRASQASTASKRSEDEKGTWDRDEKGRFSDLTSPLMRHFQEFAGQSPPASYKRGIS
ncbi:hypothetical protein QBC46DRAFT_385765 [Diplogelasinospora grovesii]|uniref:Uncharacterized protein n=1 Tax=Diplogelasinospora grovesii TaxID=303347 RepID=A0AAN6N6U1_9PEZI|nr:hypothetical protein QBC46DRAFT_385765 [Diplogelasinospora grovesii]